MVDSRLPISTGEISHVTYCVAINLRFANRYGLAFLFYHARGDGSSVLEYGEALPETSQTFYGRHPAWARAETRTTSTGALAFGCFAAIALTATSRSAAKARYRLFLYAHYLHWPVVPLMLAHCWKAPWRPLILGVLAALMAVATLLFALTGLALMALHAKRRPATWPVTALGLIVPWLLIALFVH